MKNYKSLLWGLVLIAIGVIIGINSLGIARVDLFFDGWWTLFIIIPCFIGLFTDQEKTGSIIGILIGAVLLLGCQDVIDFDIIWKLITPAILIIIGISIIIKSSSNKNINKKIKELNESKSKDGYFSAFSGQDIKIDKEEFKGTDVNAVFGGIKLDLRKAIIKKDVVINASAIFGGIDILVPENIKVKVKSTSIFGGVDNKKLDNDNNDKSNTIYVNATCLFGGIDIK